MTNRIKIIDLFSGPGGLGEGFTAHSNDFEIAISIEKDQSAQRTLKLRSFFRAFKTVPDEYYAFLKGKLSPTPEDALYKNELFSKEVLKSNREARLLELGKDNNKIRNSIDEAIGKDECILIGGPPCQAYSAVGRSKNQSKHNYSLENDPRSFLYEEYLKVVARYQPQIFVMENVKGMLSAKLNGKSVFNQIFNDLTKPHKASKVSARPGYKSQGYVLFSLSEKSLNEKDQKKELSPKDYIIYSEKHEIPQNRHRVIILGLREDLAHKWSGETALEKTTPLTSVTSVIDDLPIIRSGLSKRRNSSKEWVSYIRQSANEVYLNLKRETSIGVSNSQVGEVADYMKSLIANVESPEEDQGANIGLEKLQELSNSCPKNLRNWYLDERMGQFVTNHTSKSHMGSDLRRYLFSSCWAKLANDRAWDQPFPKSRHYPLSLRPNHANFNTGKFADRFRVQCADAPSSTVTSHLSKDGHAFIHYDPLQCRSLTVREAARLQTFTDNYFFVGTRTKQYEQVGNAVPPYLAFQIAKIVKRILDS